MENVLMQVINYRNFMVISNCSKCCPIHMQCLERNVKCSTIHVSVNMSGPMKEKELRPGTVFPVLGMLLFFLPERDREKLCCITPLAQKVTSFLPSVLTCFPLLFTVTWALNIVLVDQPKENTQPYQMATEDSNGAAFCKEDAVTEDKVMESDRALAEDEDLEAGVVPSSQLTAHTVQETAMWSFYLLLLTFTRQTHTHSDSQLHCPVLYGERLMALSICVGKLCFSVTCAHIFLKTTKNNRTFCQAGTEHPDGSNKEEAVWR